MGQKVSPVGFRTGITLGWKSRWFAPKSNYGEFLVEDEKMRRFIDDRLNRKPPYAAISSIEIERTREEVKVVLRTARPGLVIGPKGSEIDKLKNALEDLTNRRVNINIVEIKNPDLDAQLVAEGISEQLKRRSSFRRTIKQRAEQAMQAGAKGVRVMISGRLGGAEMSRSEQQLRGSIPLQTLEADVDYGFVHCRTTYGTIGVKVWIYRGMFGEQDQEVLDRRPERTGRGRRRRRGREDRGAPPQQAMRPGGSRLGAIATPGASESQSGKDESPKAPKPQADESGPESAGKGIPAPAGEVPAPSDEVPGETDEPKKIKEEPSEQSEQDSSE